MSQFSIFQRRFEDLYIFWNLRLVHTERQRCRCQLDSIRALAAAVVAAVPQGAASKCVPTPFCAVAAAAKQFAAATAAPCERTFMTGQCLNFEGHL